MRFSLQSCELDPAISLVLDSSAPSGAVEERSVRVDHPLFRSRSRMLSTGGLVVIDGENQAKSNLELRSSQLPPPIILALTLDGALPQRATRDWGMAHRRPRSYGIFYRPEADYRFDLDGGLRRRIFEINLTDDCLNGLFERFPALAETPLAPLRSGNAVSLHSPAGALAQPMLDVAQEILASSVHGPARAMFIEAKTLELISMQLAELSGIGGDCPLSAALSRAQIDRMHHARQVLLSRMVAPPGTSVVLRIFPPQAITEPPATSTTAPVIHAARSLAR